MQYASIIPEVMVTFLSRHTRDSARRRTRSRAEIAKSHSGNHLLSYSVLIN